MRKIGIFFILFHVCLVGFAQTNISKSVCSGGTVTVSNTEVNLPSGTLFSWTYSIISGAVTGATGNSGNISGFSQTLGITGNSVGTVSYAVVPTQGNPFTITITVNPTSMAVDPTGIAVNPICSGGNFYANVSGVPANTTYTWTAPLVNTGVTGAAAVSTALPYIVQKLNYTGSSTGTATYTVTPIVGGCSSPTFNFSVTINPSAATAPVITNALTIAQRCSGSIFSFTATASPAASSFAWTRPATYGISQGISNGTAAAISEVLNNTTSLPVTAYYFYTLAYSSGNCATTQVVPAVFNPVPTITDKVASVCSGSSFNVNITEDIPANTRYTWATPTISTGAGTVTGASALTAVASVSQTLTNSPASRTVPVILNYTVTPSAISGTNTCPGTTFPVTVTLNPVSTITTQQNAVVCSGQPFNFSISAFPPNTNFSWALAPTIAPNTGAITGGTAQTTPQNSISQTLVNTTTSAATATYVITPITGGCTGSTFNAVVTVNPTPAITPANQVTTVCSGARVTLNQTGVPALTTYYWEIPIVTPANAITGATALLGQSTFNQTLVNVTNAPATAVYTVFPVSGTCTGPSFTVTVTVNPTPAFTTQSVTSCSGSAFQITPANAPAGTTYTWSDPILATGIINGVSQSSPQNNISQILANTGTSPATATYSVLPSANGCTGNTFNAVVTVTPLPVVSNLTNSSCSGVSFSVTPVSSQANTTYTWGQPVSSIAGNVTGGTEQLIAQSSINDVLTNTTLTNAIATYTIIPKAAGCNGSAFTLKQTVNPTPTIASIRTEVCSQSPFSVSPPNVPFGTTYTWSNPILSPANSLTGSGSQGTAISVINQTLTNITNATATALYTVIPNTGACTGASFTVEVSVKISALVSTQTAAICSGKTFDIKPTGVPAGTTYTWTSPVVTNDVNGGAAQNTEQPNISQALTNNSTNGSNATATYTITPNSSGCIGASFNLVVTIRPLPIVPNITQTICSGTTFDVSPSSNIANTSYTWAAPVISPVNSITGSGAKTSAVQSISETLFNNSSSQASATYTVTPVVNGCSGNTFLLIENINPTPGIETQTTKVCSKNAFNIAPANVPIGVTTLYTWSAPVISPSGSITGGSNQSTALTLISQALTNSTNAVATATYNVTPISGSCTGLPFKVVVNVTPRAVINNISTNVCSGNTFSVIPSNSPSGTTYTWTAPVTSNGILGGNIQTIPQTSISQQLINSNINVTTGNAVYTVTPSTDGCNGSDFSIVININSNNSVLNSSLFPPAVCSGSVFNYVPVSNIPSTAFSWSRVAVAGISNVDISSFGAINETLINTTDTAVSVSYLFTLSANGCINLNKQIVTVLVNPAPKLNSSIKPPAICSGSSFNYAATSNTFNVAFNWSRSYVVGIAEPVDSGTGNVSSVLSNPTYNAVIVPYIFRLTANGCTNLQTIYVTVNPVITLPDMTVSSCSGSQINVTAPNAPGNTLYVWDSPVQNGGISGGSPQLLVPQSAITQTLINNTNLVGTAVYSVTPSIPATYTTGCKGRPFILSVSVNPIPKLTSALLIPSLCSGTEFSYTPTSNINGAGFTWLRDAVIGISNIRIAGTGMIKETLFDTTVNPVKLYYKFTVSANGCSDTTPVVAVTLNASPIIKTQYLTTCSGTAFVLSPDLMPSRTTYTWDNPLVIPSGSISGYKAVSVPQSLISDTLFNSGIKESTANYIIQPAGALCSLQPFNLVVTVKPVPVLGNIDTSFCSGTKFSYQSDKMPTGTRYSWQSPSIVPFGLITGSTDETTGQLGVSQQLFNSATLPATASYRVSSNINGCTGVIFTLRVKVNAIPTASVNSVSALCRNLSDTINLNFTGTGPWSYSYRDTKNSLPVTINGINAAAAKVVINALPDTNVYFFKLLRISDAFCTNDTSTLSLTQVLYPLPYDSVVAPLGTQLCVGKSLPLKTNNDLRNAYQWYLNDTLITGVAAQKINYDAIKPGYYTATVTNVFGCTNKTVNAIKMVQIFQNPLLRFSVDSTCKQVLANFTNLTDTTTTGTINWRWVFADKDSTSGYHTSYVFKNTGLQKVRLVANSDYCGYALYKDSVILIRQPETPIVMPSVFAYKNAVVPLQARLLTGSKFSYKWFPTFGLDNPAISNPNFSFNTNQTYYINIISEYGCTTTDTLRTYLFEDGLISLFVPKSFSPNGDGVNDRLYVYLAGIRDFRSFRIYNKFGQKVFETKSPDEPWDGRTNNVLQPLGAYAWVAEGIDINGKPVTQTGSVLLLR